METFLATDAGSTATPRSRLRSELILVCLTALWGTSFSIVKVAEHSLSAGSLVFLRFALAAALLAPFLRHGVALWRAGVELGFWLWAGFLTQTIGLRSISVGRSAFLTSLAVIFVPILSAWGGKQVDSVTWLAAALAFGGAAVMHFDGAAGSVSGDLWTLACALTFAIFIVRLERAAPRFKAMPLTAIQLLTVAALSLPWFAHDVLSAHAPHVPWLSITYLAVVCSALTTWLQTIGQRNVPAPQAAIIFMLEPVFAAIFAYLYLQERMGWRGVAGSGLILAATLMSQLPLFIRRNTLGAAPR
jgi:drug/metabolite transporter (DMT)-like permease